jgi:hypothetical protein
LSSLPQRRFQPFLVNYRTFAAVVRIARMIAYSERPCTVTEQSCSSFALSTEAIRNIRELVGRVLPIPSERPATTVFICLESALFCSAM